jgi:hypothetical protein
MMHPGTQVVVGIQVVQETIREVDRSIFNPFALLDAEVGIYYRIFVWWGRIRPYILISSRI